MINPKCLEKHVYRQETHKKMTAYGHSLKVWTQGSLWIPSNSEYFMIPWFCKQLKVIMITFKQYILRIYPFIVLLDSYEMWIFINSREGDIECVYLNRICLHFKRVSLRKNSVWLKIALKDGLPEWTFSNILKFWF